MGFTSIASSVWVVVGWKTCKAGEWMKAVYIDELETYIDCDSQFTYIPGASLYEQ